MTSAANIAWGASSTALLASSSSRQISGMDNGVPSSEANLAMIQEGKNAVEKYLKRDDNAVSDLAYALPIERSPANYRIFKSPFLAPFSLQRTINLPQGILEDYARINPRSAMGILPEIDRAWITMNETLYLWDYVEGLAHSFQTYQAGEEPIVHVGLVPAKPGIFVDNITHVLVICRLTTLELVAISASATTPAGGTYPMRDLNIFETGISVSTDNQEFTSITGTPEGRVFLAGGGGLYELIYQTKESWFSKQSYLINHSLSTIGGILPSLLGSRPSERVTSLAVDVSRKTLFALTNSQEIIVYDVPPASTGLNRVGFASRIASTAQSLCPGGGSDLDVRSFNITQMHPLEQSESLGIHLMAVTSTGVRLYFSRFRENASIRAHTLPTLRGNMTGLYLCYVRLPPTGPSDGLGNQPQAPWVFNEVNYEAYKQGLFLASQQLDDSDSLLCAAPDIPWLGNFASDGAVQQPGLSSTQSTNPKLMETCGLLAVKGSVWGMAPNPAVPDVSTSAGWNEYATQFSGPPQSFLVLSNSGMHLVTRRRPVEVVLDLLEQYVKDGDLTAVQEFQQNNGLLQTLAMVLAVASENAYLRPREQLVSAVAQDALISDTTMKLSPVLKSVREIARSYFYSNGGGPSMDQATYGFAQASARSPRFEALALYLSRLVRPIWTSRVTSGTGATQTSALSTAVLVSVQRDLKSLGDFLASNPHMFLSGSSEFNSRYGAGSADREAWNAEQRAATHVQTLLNQTIEAISFVLLLCDLNMPVMVAKMASPVQQQLAALTYDSLLTTQEGRETARNIINAIINQQLDQQIGVEAISEVLQQRCSSFCSADDVMLYKAQEQVRKAKELPAGRDRYSALEHSLRLFEKGARNMNVERLQSICQDYQQLYFSYGIVNLPLKCASDWDVDGRGETFFNEGCPPSDPRSDALQRRLQCYQCIIDSLAAFEKATEAALKDQKQQEAEQNDAAYGLALKTGLQSPDFVFHSHLYDWLMKGRESSVLIELNAPYAERYLLHEPRTREKVELLWQFYVESGRNMEAARCLAALAESSPFGLPLQERIRYLSLAISNAKATSRESSRRLEADAEFLSDLEDKVEVATVQLELYQRINHLEGANQHVNVDELNERLMTITELYRNYADPLELYDMKLLILHTSEHHDPALITSIWRAIFNSYVDVADRFSLLGARVSELGRRFYPSENAFPVDTLAEMLETYSLRFRSEAPPGWALRVLVEGNIPQEVALEYFDQIKSSGVAPYQDPEAIRHVLDDITEFLYQWLTDVLRPGSRFARSGFPAGKVEDLVDNYLASLRSAGNDDTKRKLSEIQSIVRSRF